MLYNQILMKIFLKAFLKAFHVYTNQIVIIHSYLVPVTPNLYIRKKEQYCFHNIAPF